MRFHLNCGPDGRRSAGPTSFGFGPGGFNFDFSENFGGRQGRGGGHRRGRRRMFEGGELRLVLLKMLSDQPRHGYELIKAIEDMTGGEYAPSPGIVYPTLTMLEDMGQIAEKKSKDSKKVYEVTDNGRVHLDENADEVKALMERLEEAGAERRRHARPEIGRAIGNMMAALKNRVARDGWNDALLEEITDILDEAAKKIERIG
jgi:DNA-binding PadR family transcriptional regulator